MSLVRAVSGSLWSTAAVILVFSAASIAVVVQVFGLTPGGAIPLYFVVWWITLFAVLPFGAQSQLEAGEVAAGTEPGAPAAPALREKAVWTTAVACTVLIVVAAVMPLAGL